MNFREQQTISVQVDTKYFLRRSYIKNYLLFSENCCCSVAKLCQLFVTPWTAAHQAFLSFTVFQSLLKFMSFELAMLANYLILDRLLLLWPSIFPSIRVFSNELPFCIRWPKYWSFSFSSSPFNEYSRLISFRLTGLISLQSKGLSRVFSNTTEFKSINSLVLSLLYGPTLTSIHDYWKNHSFD